MLRKTFIHERVVRVQKRQRTAVFEHDAFKKHFRLALHRPPQIVIKIRKDVVNRILSLEIPQVEPLAGEIRSENACAFVGKHAPDLGLQNSRVFQSSLECELE